MANEVEKWWAGKYPYDIASCGNCLSAHRFDCGNPEHAEMAKVVKAKADLLSTLGLEEQPVKAKRAFMTLRKKFARFYPKVAASK